MLVRGPQGAGKVTARDRPGAAPSAVIDTNVMLEGGLVAAR